jgi:hypothetical protein
MHGPDGDSERLCDFFGAMPFDLEQDEHGALLEAESPECALEQRSAFACHDAILWRDDVRGVRHVIGCSPLEAKVPATAMARDHAQADAEQPTRDAADSVEVRELSVHDDEHFLHQILEIGAAYSEVLE